MFLDFVFQQKDGYGWKSISLEQVDWFISAIKIGYVVQKMEQILITPQNLQYFHKERVLLNEYAFDKDPSGLKFNVYKKVHFLDQKQLIVKIRFVKASLHIRLKPC